jgi:NAD-dependent protein deacetylase/lipoamidase
VDIAADLVGRLRHARHLVVFTGAGVSAESGIPTFRDQQTGLWEKFDAEQLATGRAFEQDPALVWGWYEWRRRLVELAEPNPAHRAIATMAGRVARLTLVTQNVDDLHERAGSPRVLHLHGRIGHPYCAACGREHPMPHAAPGASEGGKKLQPPRCRHCGGCIRPGVVWFGESLPRRPWEEAVEAARDCDAFFCVGTSSMVEPAAGLTRAAIAAGSFTIQINIDHTHLDDWVTLNLRGPAAVMLPQLLAQVWPDAWQAARI